MTKRLCLRLILLLMMANAITSFAQTNFKKLKEFPVDDVAKLSIDRLGDFYLIMKTGAIRKYDTEGNFMSQFTAAPEVATQLEPWNPLKIFCYFSSRQEVLFLDRFMEPLEKFQIDPVWAIEPVMACPGTNNMVWVLDKADWSLKQIDSKTKKVLQETLMKLEEGQPHDFIYMREYQNLLFLIDRHSGLFVFNTLGKIIERVSSKNMEYVGFIGEEFYCLEDHKLKFHDLYTQEVREYAVDPLARFVLITDERMIIVKKGLVEVHDFKLE